MNRKQTKVMWIGIAVFVLMALFPPWNLSGTSIVEISGYYFVLNLPSSPTIGDFAGHINIPQLFAQWVLVAVVTGGLIVTLRDKKKSPQDDHRPEDPNAVD